jgi:uridine phosphorylase
MEEYAAEAPYSEDQHEMYLALDVPTAPLDDTLQKEERVMSTNDPRASEAPKTSKGRLYHIDVGPGELAPYILMSVDQVRAKRIAGSFDEVTLERMQREVYTCTGTYQGIPISVIGTGIGPDNTEIIFVEAMQLFPDAKPTMIRVGSSGGLRAEVAIGDLVISTGSVRLENTSTGYVDEGYPAAAHHEVILALIAAADRLGAPFHVGLTATASGFFGPEGRSVAGLAARDPELPKRLASWNVLNMEMEASALFTLGSLAGARTGAVCNIYANRVRGEWIGDDVRVAADEAAERVGLEAIRFLAAMDAWKSEHRKPHFVPRWPPQA